MRADLIAVTPLLIVALSACAVLLAESFRRPDETMPHGLLGGIGLVGAIASSVFLWNTDITGFGVIVIDHYTLFFNIVICGIGLLTILLSSGTAARDHLPTGEYQALMLFSITGMMMMGATRDLLISDRFGDQGSHALQRNWFADDSTILFALELILVRLVMSDERPIDDLDVREPFD